MTIIDPPFDLIEVHGQHLVEESAAGLEPVPGESREAFGAVYTGYSLGNAFLFGHRYMCHAQTKAGVSSILIGIIQAADGGVGVYDGQQFNFAPRRDGNGSDMPILLVDAVNDCLSFRSPTTMISPECTECRFVELKVRVLAIGLNQQVLVDTQSAESVEALNRLLIGLEMESVPVRGNAKATVREQAGIRLTGESVGLSSSAGVFEPMTTFHALEIPGRKRQEFSIRIPGSVLSIQNPLVHNTISGFQQQV